MNQWWHEMCFTIALYGVAPRQDDLELLGEIDALFSAAGLATTHLDVNAPGFSTRRRLRFDLAWKRLQRTEIECVRSVCLNTMVDGWEDMEQWLAQGMLQRHYTALVLSAVLDAMPDAIERMLGFVLDRLARIRPGYGIGYMRERLQMPYAYAMGVGYGGGGRYEGFEFEDNRLASRWSQGMNDAVWEQGVLRDVHLYNLLTARHLERDVGGMTLEAWIQAEAWHGRLAHHPPGYALWTVDQAHLLDARRALAARNALYVMGPDNHLGPLGSEQPP